MSPFLADLKKAYQTAPHGTNDQIRALSEWISNIDTEKEAKLAFKLAPSNTEVEFQALQKWIDLTESNDVIRSILALIPSVNVRCRELVIRKLNTN